MTIRSDAAVKDACKLAYGLLWLVTTPDERIKAARHALRDVLTSDERIRGVHAAQDHIAAKLNPDARKETA